jgi:hypothetical protein
LKEGCCSLFTSLPPNSVGISRGAGKHKKRLDIGPWWRWVLSKPRFSGAMVSALAGIYRRIVGIWFKVDYRIQLLLLGKNGYVSSAETVMSKMIM